MGVFCLHGTGCIPCGRTMFAPTDYSGEFAVPQNCYALCGVTFAKERVGGADFSLRYYFCDKTQLLRAFFIKSAPSRLTPNEALPHTPLRALP